MTYIPMLLYFRDFFDKNGHSWSIQKHEANQRGNAIHLGLLSRLGQGPFENKLSPPFGEKLCSYVM